MVSSKRIWLIGAGSGIGRELALKLAALGNQVIISGRTLSTLESVAAELSQRAVTGNGRILPMVCDVTSDEQVATVTAYIDRLSGGVDMLIFCAGTCEYVDDAELSTDLFRRVYDVNLFGMVNAVAAVLPDMKKAAASGGDNPQIVGVASLSAIVGLPRAEAYGSSKAAASYFLESLRLDLHRFHVDVSVVNPGFVKTPMTDANDFPMPFLMQPDDAADCIINGIAKRKRTINFPRRLTWSLRLASMFPSLWYGVIGPRLARRDG
ncbi:MAG: SDR family NAD(P)-dependent oxidoreductase [Pseudomonadota bacterium]